jgi:hypothetical protein
MDNSACAERNRRAAKLPTAETITRAQSGHSSGRSWLNTSIALRGGKGRMYNPQEVYLSVQQVASKFNLSTDLVRKLFRSEQGVLVIEQPKRFKRAYATLRIPESAVARVATRLAVR